MKKLILFFTLVIINFGLFVGVSVAETGNLTSPDFTIKVDNIYPGMEMEGSTSVDKANWILGTIIQNMMIALGAISILIMIIGAGFMILHSGDDSMLSKGKSIFTGGIYAMVIALASYYLIAAVRFLLYNVS